MCAVSTRHEVCSPGVTGGKPEASRSMPGQDEALRKWGGGPTPCCCANNWVELGIGVKVQSRLGIAGSARDCSQADLWGDSMCGRAPITHSGRETARWVLELRTCMRRRSRAVRASGVILGSEREITQRAVKVPKFRLSAKNRTVSVV
jgi:hypothetical protein